MVTNFSKSIVKIIDFFYQKIKLIIIFTLIIIIFSFTFIKRRDYLLTIRKKDDKLKVFIMKKRFIEIMKKKINEFDRGFFFYFRHELKDHQLKNEIKQFYQDVEIVMTIDEEDFFQKKELNWRKEIIDRCGQLIAKSKKIEEKIIDIKKSISKKYQLLVTQLKKQKETLQKRRLKIDNYDYYYDLVTANKKVLKQNLTYNSYNYFSSEDVLIDNMLTDLLFFSSTKEKIITLLLKPNINNNQTITSTLLEQIVKSIQLNESINFFFNITNIQYLEFIQYLELNENILENEKVKVDKYILNSCLNNTDDVKDKSLSYLNYYFKYLKELNNKILNYFEYLD